MTFTDLMDDWDEEEGGEFVKVAPCTFKDKAILFVELVIRENEKLNTKSIVTKYLSSSQHTILLSHIDNIIAGGITDSGIPNTVNNSTIQQETLQCSAACCVAYCTVNCAVHSKVLCTLLYCSVVQCSAV